MRSRRHLLRGLAAASIALAGCTGGGGGGDGTETERATATGTATATPTATRSPTQTPTAGTARPAHEAYPDYNWGMLAGVDPVATTEVTLRDTSFVPLVAAVRPGSTVTFSNEDGFGHSVTIPALDVDERLDGGESTRVAVEATGSYDYVCTFHPPGMLGRLVVTEDLPEGTATPTPTPTPTGTSTDGGGGYY